LATKGRVGEKRAKKGINRERLGTGGGGGVAKKGKNSDRKKVAKQAEKEMVASGAKWKTKRGTGSKLGPRDRVTQQT